MTRRIGATPHRTRAASVLALSAALALPTLDPSLAQETSGGTYLTFGLSQNVSLIENQALAPVSRGTTIRTTTDLSFGFVTETRDSRFSADLVTALNGVDRAGSDDGFELTAGEPRLTLRYNHQTVDTLFRARASYTDRDVAFIDPLTDFRDDDGNIVFSEDFIDLSGEGNRQSLSYGASLEIRRDRPFGLTFSADVVDIDYVDATTPVLIDSTRTTLGVVGRFDITPVTQATLGYTYEELESVGTSETNALAADVLFARPDGSLGFGVTATDTRAGTRVELRFSRDYQLPGDVAIGATLGVTRPAANEDDLYVTGALSYARPLPNGSISARLARSFGTGSEGQEEVQTSLSVSSSYEMTPIATLGIDGSYARVEDTGSDAFSEIASLGATVTYALTREWEAEAGVTFETSDTEATDRGERSTLSFTLSRDFTFRP